MHAQSEATLATDFFTVDLLDGTSVSVLAVIEHATRRMRILGVTAHPSNAWVSQMDRNLLTDLDERGFDQVLPRDPGTTFAAVKERGVHRCWDPDSAQSDPSHTCERDRGTLDR